jgi:hypothetical protein
MGWLAAATVAVLLAWQGVERVGTSVTNRHERALTADEARETLAAGSTGDSGDGGTGTTPPSGEEAGAGGNTTSTTARQSRPTATTTATTRPSVSTLPPSPSPGGSATTVPPAAGTTTSVVRTYNLVGGSATLRFDPSGKVSVVWANPNPGYRVDVDDRSDGGVRVRFDGDSHRSELEAWWDGQPRDRIEESGDEAGGPGPG